MSSKRCDHKSVGMIVRKDGYILLIKRRTMPFGFAAPAGHVDQDPTYGTAAKRELQEEVGLTVISQTLVINKIINNPCRRKYGSWHHWKVYEVETAGKIYANQDEVSEVVWVSSKRLQTLSVKTQRYIAGGIIEEAWKQNPGLEPVWYDLFKSIKLVT